MQAFFIRPKTWLGMQAFALAAGNIVGWSTIFSEIRTFCDEQGQGLRSLTAFDGTFTTNPLLTPCFWGSVVFLIAFAWTASLLMEKNSKKVRLHTRRLWWLLLAGSIFALVNNVPMFYGYYTKPDGVASCSGGVVGNPFATSCFWGLAAFVAAFVFATVAKRLLSRR